jgi:hypothetical protein
MDYFMEKDLRPCTANDFDKTDYEREIWRKMKNDKKYCIDVNDADIKKFEL